jgi:hypothetical protein
VLFDYWHRLLGLQICLFNEPFDMGPVYSRLAVTVTDEEYVLAVG